MFSVRPSELPVNGIDDAQKSIDTLQRAKVQSAIHYSMLLSGGVGIVPIPLVDFVGVTAIQLALVKQLSGLYGVEYASGAAKRTISAIVGGALPAFGAIRIGTWVKLIPIVGPVLGGSAMMLLSGASTYAVGQLFAKHFEQGGTILDLQASQVKKEFAEYYAVGKAKLSRKKAPAVDAEVGTQKDANELAVA